MSQSKVNVAQLQKRDPAAWTTLLHTALEQDHVSVSAVDVAPLGPSPGGNRYHQQSFRYRLTLRDHSDPITLIGKRTNERETSCYQHFAHQIPWLAPRCYYASYSGEEGWIVIDDVPDHFPPPKWTLGDVEAIVQSLARLHLRFWKQGDELRERGIPHFIEERKYTWQELEGEHEVFFEEGPAAVISEHAVESAGRLAPALLAAANGLTVIRDLGGWPGVLGESHLTAAADLLDDPVPMLAPLRDLPVTLLHGNPYSYHWRVTLFDEMRLFSWRKALVGPGICDLVTFVDQFDLLFGDGAGKMYARQDDLVSDETMVDSYLLSMSSRLGSAFDARSFRQAIPAARCLHVLTTWFADFAKWFSEMPNKYTWQRVNRMRDDQLAGTIYEPMIGFRPYAAAVFQRFLRAYRTL